MMADTRSNIEVITDALRDGRIGPARAQFWSEALDADPSGARKMLAMLEPVPNCSKPAAAGGSKAPCNKASASPMAPPAAPTPQGETLDELNARINADPEMQAFMWRMGIRDGIEAPPVVFTREPDYEAPWDPKPRMVTNADGSVDQVFPEPDFSGSMLADDSWDSPRSAARLDREDRMRRQNLGDDAAWD